MAISAGMALASTAVGVATGATLAFGGTLARFGIGKILSHFLVTTALGAALNALTPKPSLGKTGGYRVTQTGSTVEHQIIYGRVRVAGARVFDASTGTDNRYLHRVLAIAGHEVESIDEIYFNDELLTIDGSGNVTAPSHYAGHARINEHLGTASQTADTDLVAEVTDWTTEHRLRGIAYVYVRFAYDADAYPNGVPEVTFTVKGKKVYDPRTLTTAWSDNSALCIRDYLTDSSYGLGEDASNIDDVLADAAADTCDLTDTPDSSTRYTCNGAFTTALTPYDILQNLLTSMGGLLWYAQGKWRMKPAEWTAPTLTLTEDDLRSNITVSTRHSRRDNFNTVKGTFSGAETNWQVTDYPEVSNAAFVSADNGQASTIDLDLPFTDTAVEARRIANVFLERNRQQLTVQANFGLRAFELQVGDNVQLTNARFGWSNKAFEVVAWAFTPLEGDLQVQMTLRETASAVFDDINDGVIYEQDNTALLSPFEVPTVGISVAAISTIVREKLLNSLEATITSSESERVDLVEFEYKKNADSEWIKSGTGELGKFVILDLEPDFYDIRARAINTFGIKGAWTTITNQEIDATANPPADVTNFIKELSGGTTFLSWSAVTDPDLSYYEIRHENVTSGATWGTSAVAVERVGRPSTSVAVPARSGTFLIKAWDKTGNQSVNEATVVTLPGELPELGTTDTQTEDPTFTGTKTDTVIDTGPTPDELIIGATERATATPSGIYDFSTYIDTGTPRTARVTGNVTFNRHFDHAGDWDGIPGNWDTWPGNWDQWDDEQAAYNDITVVVQASATDDDPSGSPTWGAWQTANGGEMTGRAFRFRVLLDATNTGASPSIETLNATVEY